ncbi:MAG: hypothetical protein VR70_16480 [Rhodospirillaceae bacterium BRH_c57]|nr:MAG: hypothetical protein VR70_16480 [Rhodospirillaceae bacterium BRH_c57]
MARRYGGGDAPVVVVTGASAGLGRAIAGRFARDGWKVGLIARDPVRLAEAAADCVAKGSPRAIPLVADVADWPAMQAAAKQAERELGPVEVWVNSAMATVFSPVAAMTAEEYRRVSEVTYLGQVHGTLAALEPMRARGRGTIMFVGSALAYRGLPLQSAYSAAKFAVRGFFESLRAELIAENSAIHVGMVQMPAMNTPQFDWARCKLTRQPQPVPPIYQPEPCANAVVRAVYNRQREVWVGRSSLKLIGAAMLLPGGLIDRMMARQGVSGQKGEAPFDSSRPDNLEAPVPGRFGTRGRFGSVARRRVWDVDADVLRTAVGLSIGAAGLVLGLLAARRKPR